MNDQQIVQLFFQRNEHAIAETRKQYGAYCLSIVRHLLYDPQDAEEALQDTWLAAWNSIPPHQPVLLRTYLGKIARRTALKKVREKHALKRGGGELPLVLDELLECLTDEHSIEKVLDAKELKQSVERFLTQLNQTERRVFLCRYWYLDSIESIAERFGFSQSKVKSMLQRLRKRLCDRLVKEGYI